MWGALRGQFYCVRVHYNFEDSTVVGAQLGCFYMGRICYRFSAVNLHVENLQYYSRGRVNGILRNLFHKLLQWEI